MSSRRPFSFTYRMYPRFEFIGGTHEYKLRIEYKMVNFQWYVSTQSTGSAVIVNPTANQPLLWIRN